MAVDIVGIGTPVMDMIVNLPFLPTEDGAVRANEMIHQGGGKIATGMVACARLGAKAGVLAKLGGNNIGDFIISDFQYNKVDTSHILRGAPDTSSHFVISLSEAKNSTRIFIGRSQPKYIEPMTVDEIDFDYIASAKYLLIENGNETSIAAAKFAKEKGLTVAIDADYFVESMEDILPWVDVFIGSEYYYQKRFENMSLRESCEAVRAIGPPVVWFTLGARGCVGLLDGEYHELPSYKVDVMDTTGAGDVFHGAYLVAMMDGMSHRECAQFSSAVSAIKCTYPGGRTGIPSREITDRFMKDGIIDKKELDERLEYYRTSFNNIVFN